MNIFIMILVALFMAGYYMMDSPNQKIQEQETEYAIGKSDMRMIAQCATAVHNAQIKGTEFQDICIEQNNIVSQYICLDNRLNKTKCEIVKNKKPAYSYIVTATAPIDSGKYNDMMEILEQEYSDAGTFGIFNDNVIMSGGTSTKRIVPKTIIKELELTPGQLVYLTQYEIPDNQTEYVINIAQDIECPVGTVKVYRFGRWQCTGYNTKTNCGGDMVWDTDLMECVPDESRKPLCANNQTAVMVDSVWECISPFPEKSCPDKMVAQLNYNTLEWECVGDPADIQTTTKCDKIRYNAVYGAAGTTLRVPQTSCTDCEKMVVDEKTCVAHCVPDETKITDPRCYNGSVAECSGPTRAFFFGFPNREYVTQSGMNITNVPLGSGYSQNRRFNCKDCGETGINSERSNPPYVVVCN